MNKSLIHDKVEVPINEKKLRLDAMNETKTNQIFKRMSNQFFAKKKCSWQHQYLGISSHSLFFFAIYMKKYFCAIQLTGRFQKFASKSHETCNKEHCLI